MANVIDTNIVEMKFDNGQFERGVQQTIGTIGKLKENLNFEGAVKGLSDLGSAAKSLTLTSISTAVDSVGSKFSALQEVAVGALRRIGEEAANAGLKLLDFGKALSIDQIANGFDKYAQKTSSVQTIMAATADQFTDTGEQMEYVNGQLEKLNWFTDETSYNFLDMVSSIGKFTSNGIELEKAVTAMQGISNWAAISGQSKNEASRAMYNLSQALAVGEVKLMDWRSIENANMATKEFKEKVLEAAAANGQLKKEAEGVYTTIGKGTKVTIENFSSALSEGWFDSDTLMDVLDEYGNVTDKLYDLSTQTGATATDILTLVEAQQKGKLSTAQLADVLGDAATPTSIANLRKGIEDLASAENEFGIKTFRAAQEAKTFEEAVDSVKDAVSTGWMQSFELIFGDYDKARVLWTDVANNMWDIFNSGAEGRNQLLKDWASSGWEKLEKKVRSAGVSVDDFEEKIKRALMSDEGGAYSNLGEIINEFGSIEEAVKAGAIAAGDVKYAVKDAINDILSGSGSLESVEDKLKEVQKVVSDVWSGSLGNGADRKKAVEALGLDYDMIQNLVDKGAEYQVQLSDLTDEQLKAIGLGEEEIELLRSILDDEELLSNLGKQGGRELFAEAINQGLVDIVQTLEVLKSTWNEVFGSLEGGTLRDMTEQLRDFMQSLALYEENSEGIEVLTERGSRLKETLEKVFTAAKNTFGVLQNGGRLTLELAGSTTPAVEAVNRLAESFVRLYNEGSKKFAEFLSNLDFSERLTPVAERIAGIIDGITERVDNLRLAVQGIGDIEGELRNLGKGGGVDLLNRPILDAKEVLKTWGEVSDGIATLYSSTYSNKDGTIAANFTPIIVDENGNYVATFTPEHLQKYAEGVLNGTQEDLLHLQIGATFEGDDAVRRAEEAAEHIHELHESLYETNEDTEKLKGVLTDIKVISYSISSIFDTIANSSIDIAEAFAPVGEAFGNLSLVAIHKFANFMENLALFAENVRKAFNPLVNTIGQDLAKGIDWVSEKLGNLDLNKIFGGVSQVFAKLLPIAENVWTILTNIGSTIGTLFESLAPVLEPLGNIFLKLLDVIGKLSGKLAELSGKAAKALEPVLKTIGDALTKVFDTVDKLLGKFKLGDIIDKISGALSKAGEVTGGVGEKFKTFFDNLAEGNGLSETFGNVWDRIVEIFNNVKSVVEPVFKSISENLKPMKENLDKFWKSVKEGFDFKDAKTMGDYIEKLFSGLGNVAVSALRGFIDGVSNIDFGMIFKGITAAKVINKLLYFKTMISDIMSSLGDGLEGFGTNLYDWIFGDFSIEQLADAILKFAGAIGILTLAIVALSLIPEENITKGISALENALLAVLAPLWIFYESLTKMGASMFGLQMAGTAILETAAAVLILAGALAAFSYIAEHMDASGGLLYMVASLAAVVVALDLLASKIGALQALGIGAAMILASTALIVLAGALAAFCLVVREFGEEAGPALVLLGVTLGGVTLALIALSDGALQALAGAAALLVVAVAVTALAGAIAVWALVVQNFDVAAALMAMGAAFLVVGAAMAGFGMGAATILAGALTLAAASVSIVIFSAALAAFLLVLQLAEPALTSLSNGFSALGNGLMDLLNGLGIGLENLIGGIIGGIGLGFEKIGEGIGTGITAVGTGIAAAEELIGQGFESMSKKIGDSSQAAGEKINLGLTAISEGIGKIGESFGGIASGIADIGTALGTFSTNVSGLGLIDLITIGSGLKSVADGIKQLNKNPLTADASAVTTYATALQELSNTSTEISTIKETLNATMLTMGTEMVQNLASGIRDNASQVATEAETIVTNLKVSFDGAITDATTSGNAIGTEFVQGIQNGVSGARAAGEALVSAAIQILRSAESQFQPIGYNFSAGLARGISSGTSVVTSAVRAVVNSAIQAARAASQENSPSKVFAGIGNFMSLGMAEGISNGTRAVSNATDAMVQNAIDEVSNAMLAISDAINSDLDSEPTITPVLDLSNVKGNSKKLADMLGQETYSVKAVGTIANQHAQIQEAQFAQKEPIVASIDPALAAALMNQANSGPVDVKINFNGSLAQLAAVLQPAIVTETNRIGKSLINA